MHKSLMTLAVAIVLLLATTVPASASTWVQIRYSNTNDVANNVGFQSTWTSPLIGASVRTDFMGGMWAGSFNFDSGAINNFGPGAVGTGAYNRFWDFNLHRNMPLPSGMASIFVGWGSIAFETPNFPGGGFVRQTGPRAGVDAKVMFATNWYAVGSFAYQFSGNGQQLNAFSGGTAAISGSALDYHAGIGRTFGNWAIEGGYRVIDLNVSPSAATCATTPCNLRWPGWYVGLNFTTP